MNDDFDPFILGTSMGHLEGWFLLASSWDAAKHPTRYRTALTTKNCQLLNVSIVPQKDI